MAVWDRLIRWFGGGLTRQPGQQSGLPTSGNMVERPVTAETALQLSPVWACVKLISETVAGLPIRFYSVDRETLIRSPNNGHPLAELLSAKPNRHQTRFEFVETMTAQLALHGNAYALIARSGNRIVSLMPLMSRQVEKTLLKDGSVVFTYNDGERLMVFAEKSVWHVKIMGNGIVGLETVAYARNAIGIGIAAEQRVATMANRGFKPAAVLMLDKLLKPDQRAQIREQFKDLAIGDDDPLKVLEAGMKYQQITITPKDAQLLESRKYQLEEVCRFFGVPPVLVGDTGGTTTLGAGIEQIVQGFYKFCIRPYLERYEASIRQNLIDVSERRMVDVEFDFRALLRGDDEARYTTYSAAVQGGVKTPNECRALEGDPPKPGGDDLYMQQQMVKLGTEPEKTE